MWVKHWKFERFYLIGLLITFVYFVRMRPYICLQNMPQHDWRSFNFSYSTTLLHLNLPRPRNVWDGLFMMFQTPREHHFNLITRWCCRNTPQQPGNTSLLVAHPIRILHIPYSTILIRCPDGIVCMSNWSQR